MNLQKKPLKSKGRVALAFAFFAMLVGIVALSGCSKNATDASTTDSTNVLNDPNGGFTATNEPAGFGDPTLVEQQDGEVEYSDPMEVTNNVDSLIELPMAGLYHIRVLWGHLQFDSTELDVTDWSGSLTTTAGCEVLRRVIRFEAGDSILPRTDRKKIEWASHTRPHNDGIAADIIVPPAKPIIDTQLIWVIDTVLNDSVQQEVIDTTWQYPVTAQVTFQTGPYSRTFSLDELSRLDTIITLEDGNVVAFTAFRFERFLCPKGFLGGHWGYDDSGNGIFSGIWMDRHGPSGFVRGRWGTNDAGENVFFGKWISRNGLFEGMLRGRWKHHPNPHADSVAFERAGGSFAGKIFNAADIEIGVVRGLFRTHPEEKAGGFVGRWKLNCPGGNNEMRPPDDDGMNAGL